MGLFDLLNGARHRASTLDERTRGKLLEAWGLADEEVAARAPEVTPEGTPLDYDRTQWVRKLRHILDELPESEPRWGQLVQEARAKQFDEAWVRRLMLEEFAMMIRRAVADRLFTERERRKLDQARVLIGLNAEEARGIYANVVREAEAFFGEHVEGT